MPGRGCSPMDYFRASDLFGFHEQHNDSANQRECAGERGDKMAVGVPQVHSQKRDGVARRGEGQTQ